MTIDWFTFAAQVVNFVILLLLLKRFLYRPVLEAVDRREARIREHLERAHEKEREAEEERRGLEERRMELEARQSDLIREAEEEAQSRRRELTQQVRDEARRVREDWHESLRRGRETFLEELRRRVGEEIYTIVRRVLADLADEELEDRVVRVFMRRLAKLPTDERDTFVRAMAEFGGRTRVRSAFPLTDGHHRAIEEIVEAWSDSSVEVQFEHDPELALGIEIGAGARKIAWSVGSYIDALEGETRAFIEAEVE